MQTNEIRLLVMPFGDAKFVCLASAPVYVANGRVQSKYFARFLLGQWGEAIARPIDGIFMPTFACVYLI